MSAEPLSGRTKMHYRATPDRTSCGWSPGAVSMAAHSTTVLDGVDCRACIASSKTPAPRATSGAAPFTDDELNERRRRVNTNDQFSLSARFLATLDAERARSRSLVEALEFYRNPANYARGCGHGVTAMEMDCGRRAEAALAADPAPREEGTNE